MKKFRFRLDTLLKVRQRQKEQAELEYAAAANRLISAESLLEQIKQQLSDSMASFQISRDKLISIELLKTYHSYFDKIRKDIVEQKEQVRQKKLERQEKLTLLHAAMNKLKIIENLRTKRFEEFRTELLREEQQQLDELGMQLYVRQVR